MRARSKATPPVPVAWVSLDKGDNDVARFLAYLISTLQTIQRFKKAAVGESVLMAHQSVGIIGSTALSTAAQLTGLITEIAAASPDPFVLVLDDYHVITEQQVHDELTFAVDNLPPQMHLVIATRADPPLPIARLRARGQMTELRQADLSFTLDEATAFLDQVVGSGLLADDVATLSARTEGWIAGLQMAALALDPTASMQEQGTDRVASFIQGFSGSDRYVLDYMVEEVLQRQPGSAQTFLLQTAILDRMTGPL